jgi:hypothetical protein
MELMPNLILNLKEKNVSNADDELKRISFTIRYRAREIKKKWKIPIMGFYYGLLWISQGFSFRIC